ncbi:uncharacterized protein FIBRA_01354 [Fibroporia radiculosa]|uniref:ATP-dependent rRNA helicase RRP3 n=1 Tax=Fibroporia radiculosa TaxID=599839 RepID=J4I8F8_9APHY|nr:uncharacterized protein FIBRA_01354 [Fibroporia radiculosa]CCL99336.1 predicted protein [Fibroporia radiculosa]
MNEKTLPVVSPAHDSRINKHAHRSSRLIVVCIVIQVAILVYRLTGPPKSFSRILPAQSEPDFSHLADHCAHVSPITASSFLDRQQSLAQTLHALNISAYVAEPGPSAGYFANLSSSQWGLSERPLLLIVSPKADAEDNIRAQVSILTPAFEVTRAKLLSIPTPSDIEYVSWPEDVDPFSTAVSAISSLSGNTIVVDGMVRSFISDGLKKAAPNSRIALAPVEIRRLRERKSEQELEIMKCVNEVRRILVCHGLFMIVCDKVTVLAIRAVRENMYIGMRESEARRMIVGALGAAGLRDPSALTLFGENAALPHGSGTDRILGPHDFVLIDCDGSLHGYQSDVTRTFALPGSSIHAAHLRLWHLVHSAQANALRAARNGTMTADVDRAARDTFAAQSYAQYFTHRLGHGIGLEVHESPYLRGGSDDLILTGHTFSDEPGIYIEGQVGVRLEDCFYVHEDGNAVLLTAGNVLFNNQYSGPTPYLIENRGKEILTSVESLSRSSQSVCTLAVGLPSPAPSMPSPEEATTSDAPAPVPAAATDFRSLGLIDPLLEALEQLNFKHPTDIQVEALPHALQGRDIIGVASTGSGKTAAFALPILQKLWEEPKGLFACVLAPTRELAYQISQQFEGLGSAMGVRCVTIVGGLDMMAQSVALAKRPHIVVATPGRLIDHLENTKGFSLRGLKFLVLDEADRLLDMDFGPIIDKILKIIPKERTTYLFSATMTTKVAKLQRASLSNPVRVEVSEKYSTVSTLLQYYLFIPLVQKDVHLIYLANTLAQNSIIIFTRTVHDAQRLSIILRTLGFPAVPLHGQLSQSARLGALGKFKSGGRKILVATDVASRGLDIPHVDVVINYDIPTHSKDYIHRVGRTARAGRSGKSVTLVTQYDVELIQRIETTIGKKMELWPTDAEEIALLRERVDEASRVAINELKEQAGMKKSVHGRKRRKEEGGGDDRDRDDDTVEAGMPSRKKRPKMRR